MTSRFFRLTEIHQRIDERLRLERRRAAPDFPEMLRLMRRKLRAKRLIRRLDLTQPVHA